MIEKEHQEIVDEIQTQLTMLGIKCYRPQLVYNELYHPDACVKVNHDKFIPIEVINSNYGFDILGMLSLVMCKDIISYGVCIITDKLYQQDPEKYEKVKQQVNKFQKYSKTAYGNKLIIIREHEAIPWFKKRLAESTLWSPE